MTAARFFHFHSSCRPTLSSNTARDQAGRGVRGPIRRPKAGQCPDCEVRSILRRHVSNFGIERTLAKPLISCGFGPEVRMASPRHTRCGLLNRHTGRRGMNPPQGRAAVENDPKLLIRGRCKCIIIVSRGYEMEGA